MERSELYEPTSLVGLSGCQGNLAGYSALYRRDDLNWTAFISEPFTHRDVAAACAPKLRLSDNQSEMSLKVRASKDRVVGIVYPKNARTFTDKGYILNLLEKAHKAPL